MLIYITGIFTWSSISSLNSSSSYFYEVKSSLFGTTEFKF